MTRAEYNDQRLTFLAQRLRAATPAAFDRIQHNIALLDQWAPGYAVDPHGIRELLDMDDDEDDAEDDAEEVAA